MRVAIFGSGGYVGQRLVERLSREGVETIPYSSGAPGTFDPSSGVICEDIRIPAGTDCVIYLSQSPRYREMPAGSGHLWGVNVLSAIRVANLARQVGARRFVHASTGNVYEPSFSPLSESCALRRDDWYALSKVHAEESLALFRNDLSVLSARVFGVYGPGQTGKLVPNLIHSVRNNLPIKLETNPHDTHDHGGFRVSLTYIDDVVAVFSGLVSSDIAGEMNVAGPGPRSIREIAEAIGEQTGFRPSFELGAQPRAFNLIADITRLTSLCAPHLTPFDEGLRATLAR